MLRSKKRQEQLKPKSSHQFLILHFMSDESELIWCCCKILTNYGNHRQHNFFLGKEKYHLCKWILILICSISLVLVGMTWGQFLFHFALIGLALMCFWVWSTFFFLSSNTCTVQAESSSSFAKLSSHRFQVCGLVLLALGLWTMHDKAFLEELLRNRLYMNTTYTILFSSILMILLSGFGWFAAMKEIKCFLLTYFVLLFLLSIITMVGGVLAYVFREQVFLFCVN